ncbi:MAG: aldehyde dehydrogenase family protein [Actinobacteria bacterium]|nr:aldehyde dehydrogenase family protein [Actinomycetota bacterium]
MRTLADTDRWGPWIDGADVTDGSRHVASVDAPYDARHLADVEQAGPDDLERAVTVATAAYQEHRDTPAHVRAGWLQAAADVVSADADALAGTMVDVLGKPVRMCRGEVGRGVALLRLCAEELARFGGETLPLDAVPGGEGHWGFTRREPFGVIGAITPFNAPVNLLLQKVAPALAVGNAVVVKPAPEGAITALQLAELLDTAVPPGLLAVLNGDAALAQTLAGHRGIAAVSLTGGVAAGESIVAAAGLKPVMLELGSNSPNIVCADADLDDAAKRIAGAAFGASGQQCISAQRIIVERPVFDDFTDRFVEAARGLRLGDPADPSTDIGPLVSDRRREHVLRFLADAEERGAKVVLDGRADDLLFGPSIVRDVPADALLVCEEVFGPVAVLMPANDLGDAIAQANDSDLGLQASCFTRSLANALHAAERLQAGTVHINEPSRFRLDTYPFGGYKRSGLGREGVRYAMEALSQLKFVSFRAV